MSTHNDPHDRDNHPSKDTLEETNKDEHDLDLLLSVVGTKVPAPRHFTFNNDNVTSDADYLK